MKANKLLLKTLVSTLCASLALAGVALAAPTDIATQPLAQPAANVPPNIMLLLDDSGSMIQQYTPDYLGRHFGGSNQLCLDGKDDNGAIDTNLDNCEVGDPPLMTPDLNTQYYNADIRYFPAVNYDGSSMPSMTAANTNNWTQVPTDSVSLSSQSAFRKDSFDMNGNGATVNTANLVTNYPDRAWCKSQSDSATGSNCRTNASYSYPDPTFSYGLTNGTSAFYNSGSSPVTNIKFIYGAPYYYRIVPTVYCTDYTLTNCTSATAPTGSYTVPAPVRYCNSTALDNCQAKYQGSYTIPQYSGFVATVSPTPKPATSTLTVKNPQSDSSSGTITGIFVKGINLIASPVSATGPISPSAAALSIASAINGSTGTTGYSATVGTTSTTNNIVTITAPSSCVAANTCSTWNSASMVVQSPGTPVTPATSTFTITSTTNRTSTVNSITVNGTSLFPSSVSCNGGCSSTTLAGMLVTAINSGGTGFTATSANNVVTVTAPTTTGAELNGTAMNLSHNFRVSVSPTTPTFSGGATADDIETKTTNFTGGTDSNSGRTGVGQFVRTNVTPFQDPPTNSIPKTFPKGSARSDCAGSTCTYAEEMTNFANWYAYYRMRDTMAKTAIGRAFAAISDQYRVGFISLNPGNPVQSSRYLNMDAFTAGSGNQKDLWYQRVYGTGSNGSTPLREALSRVGRYYAGVTSGINSGMDGSPIQYSCQPNFTLAMTDGYWNGNSGDDLSGNSIGNQDNVDAGYSTRAIGAYDGGLSGATNTLADVAMYYYKTDLRTDLADNVPTTQTDNAPHQHMTTYTVGLGLAGQLQFDPNYLTQTSGDFVDIKQGVKNWPVPAADSETALDDLWHAAVNGHGQFFSAKDPVSLALGIGQTLAAVASRVGAGAAAATSNLQPVAGDNFAFTAQYQTVEWTGDLIARTIDLSTGIVANRALWSAQAQLDQRSGPGRHIYTYDATDNSAPSTGNGNLLKAFCWPGAAATSLYPGCNGEGELSATDMAYFDPTTLIQAGGWNAAQTTAASPQKLVDYLRGDPSNEDTGNSLASDLFRKRNHLLGDIVDAQPAYVKAAPFAYNVGAYAGIDPFYQQFKQSTDGTTGTRIGTVFAAANDGMLHAFETDPDNNPYYQTAGISTTTTTDDTFTGTLSTDPRSGEGAERWAYVPNIVLSKMKYLANEPYIHQYTVDGSPVVGDVCFGHTLSTPCAAQSNWHTILVAGLNGGGRGYYALDITDPQNPKALWELKGGSGTTCLTNAQANSGTYFQDCNIGLSFGNPVITKRKSDGKWVVIVTSGYNNYNPGDGQGHLYMVDAQTGAILSRIDTGVGCNGLSSTAPCVAGTPDPSGLARINAWIDNAFNDNTALRVYGGDLKGNLWRFQLDPSQPGYMTAYKLTTLVDAGGTPQPITARPDLGEVQNFAVIYVGTGKLLGTSDTATTPTPQTQSIYAVRDDLTSGSIARSDMVQQTLTALNSSTRTSTGNAVDFNTKKGWFIDLPDTGERVNVDPILQLGTLVVASNIPSADTCLAGGYSWVNFLDYRTGSYVPGASANMASTKIAASLVVGTNVVQLPGGKVVTIVTTADNQQLTQETPISSPSVTGRRVTWRELISE
ncbi:MAG: PilC/PilY family type IV pilus protein [Burkholderiales bacterium]